MSFARQNSKTELQGREGNPYRQQIKLWLLCLRSAFLRMAGAEQGETMNAFGSLPPVCETRMKLPTAGQGLVFAAIRGVSEMVEEQSLYISLPLSLTLPNKDILKKKTNRNCCSIAKCPSLAKLPHW